MIQKTFELSTGKFLATETFTEFNFDITIFWMHAWSCEGEIWVRISQQGYIRTFRNFFEWDRLHSTSNKCRTVH